MHKLYQVINLLKLDQLINYILRDKLRIVMYHGIIPDDSELDCWWLLKKKKFKEQVNYLADNFNIISIDEAVSSNCLPEKSCVITFDDGYKSVLTEAYPFLSNKGIPFTVYITTGPVENKNLLWPDNIYAYLYSNKVDYNDLLIDGIDNCLLSRQSKTDFINDLLKVLKQMEYNEKNVFIKKLINTNCIADKKWSFIIGQFEVLTIDDIKKLSNDPLVTIGAHTVNHEILTQMPLDDAVKEISESRDALERWTGNKICHFAYPDGQYNKKLASMVENLNFKSAAQIGLFINWNINKYELCRVGTGATDDDIFFRMMVNNVIPFKRELSEFSSRRAGGLRKLRWG